jgi:hypothetical protein
MEQIIGELKRDKAENAYLKYKKKKKDGYNFGHFLQ